MFQHGSVKVRPSFLEKGVLVEHDERIVFVDRPYAVILGYEPKILWGQHISSVISETDCPRLLDYGRQRVTGRVAPCQYGFLARRKDGSPVPVQARVSSSVDASGTFIKTVLETPKETDAADESQASVEEIYDRFAPHVYAALLGMVGDANEASDILMESFERSIRGNLPVSLAALLSEAALQAERRGKARASEQPSELAALTTRAATTAEPLSFEEWQAQRARTSLTPEERKAIELAYFDKFSVGAIAELLSASHDEVRELLISGMRRLRGLRFVDEEGAGKGDL